MFGRKISELGDIRYHQDIILDVYIYMILDVYKCFDEKKNNCKALLNKKVHQQKKIIFTSQPKLYSIEKNNASASSNNFKCFFMW